MLTIILMNAQTLHIRPRNFLRIPPTCRDDYHVGLLARIPRVTRRNHLPRLSIFLKCRHAESIQRSKIRLMPPFLHFYQIILFFSLLFLLSLFVFTSFFLGNNIDYATGCNETRDEVCPRVTQ